MLCRKSLEIIEKAFFVRVSSKISKKMPKEKPIIPYGIPNPIGPAVFPGLRNHKRKGGELPEMKYPLVCRGAIPFESRDTVMSLSEWKRLNDIITKADETKDQETKERLEKLRQQSQMLQMGWPDNNKDVVKKLAEKFLTNTPKDRDIREIAQREKAAEAKVKVGQGWPLSMTDNDERHVELQQGLVLSEVLAQRDEHAAIAQDYKQLCKKRDEFEEKQRQDYDNRLTDNHSFREKMAKNYNRRIQMFQKEQARKKEHDDQLAKDTFNAERREYVTKLANHARSKAFVEFDEKKELAKAWGKMYTEDMVKKQERRKNFDELERGLLDLAKHQEDAFVQETTRQKVRDNERVIATGAKQKKAADWLKENVFDKVVDDEDERIRRDVAKKDQTDRMKEIAEKRRKDEIVDALMAFHLADRRIKVDRRLKVEEDKRDERAKNLRMFGEFIDHIGLEHAKKQSTIKLYTQFWDDQCKELNERRRLERQTDVDLVDAVKLNEDVDEENIEKKAEDLIHFQGTRGRNTIPLRKAKKGLALGMGPTLQAADNLDHRLHTQAKDMFYKPEHSRQRLSINWDD